MFRQWLKSNRVDDFTYTGKLFPDITDRTYWDALFDERYVTEGEKYLGFAWPIIRATHFMEFTRSGNRSVMEAPHFARRCALCVLSIAEVMENKGRFLGDIVDGIYLICEESYWGVSAHWQAEAGNIHSPEHPYIDLFAAQTAEVLALIYHLLYAPLNDFCPEILERIEYEMNRRIFVPYLEHRDYRWMGYKEKTNNWNPWIISNVMLSFFLLERNPRRVEKAVGKMMIELQTYVDSMPDDGGCDEGPGYWWVAGLSLFECVYQLKTATNGGINLMADAKFRRIMSYVETAYIGRGKFLNFADSQVGGPGMIGEMIYLVGRELEMPRLMALGRLQYNPNAVPGASYGEKLRRRLLVLPLARELLQAPEFIPADFACLPDLQVCTLRRGDWFLGAKGGHNAENHNHNDVGSFILYDDSTPVLIDPGVGEYTRQTFSSERYTIWTMQSIYHNLPEIGGIAQQNGKKFCADRFSCDAEHVHVSFATAYPPEAGFEQLERSLVLQDDGIELCDKFVFRGDRLPIIEHLMTPHRPIETEKGLLLDGKWEIRCPDSVISVDEIDLVSRGMRGNWGQDSLWRINLTLTDCACVNSTVRRI